MVESFAQRIGLRLSFDNSLIYFLNLSVNLSRNAAGLIGEAGIGLFFSVVQQGQRCGI